MRPPERTQSVPEDERPVMVRTVGAEPLVFTSIALYPPKSAVPAVRDAMFPRVKSPPRTRVFSAVTEPLPEMVPDAVRLSAVTVPVTVLSPRTASFALRLPVMSALLALKLPAVSEPEMSAFSFAVMLPLPVTVHETVRLSAERLPSAAADDSSGTAASAAVTDAPLRMAEPFSMVNFSDASIFPLPPRLPTDVRLFAVRVPVSATVALPRTASPAASFPEMSALFAQMRSAANSPEMSALPLTSNFPLPPTVPEAVRFSAVTEPVTSDTEPSSRVRVPAVRDPDTSAPFFTVIFPLPSAVPAAVRLSAVTVPLTVDFEPSARVRVPAEMLSPGAQYVACTEEWDIRNFLLRPHQLPQFPGMSPRP